MKRFKNILFLNEPEVEQSSEIRRAVSLAEKNRARLTFLEVIPRIHGKNRDVQVARRLEELNSIMAPYKQRLELVAEVVEGTIFIEVIRAVLRNGHDLVIKSAENPDFLKQVFGSDDMHLLRKCPCPVWLMKLPEKEKYDRVLAAVDFKPLQHEAEVLELNMRILEIAGSLAVADSAALHLVHAWEAYAVSAMKVYGDAPDKQIATHVDKQYTLHREALLRLWEIASERVENAASLTPRFHLPKGSAKRMIPSLGEELQADLIVMGTIARTGITGLFIGNTAESILNQLSCSVLAIKPSTFKTPVTLDESGSN